MTGNQPFEPVQNLYRHGEVVKRAISLALGFLLVSAGVAAGCASFARDAAAEQTLAIVSRSIEAGAREPDLELARAAIPGGLFQLAAFAAQYPERAEFRALHADALCGYALGWVFDDWDAAALAPTPADPATSAAADRAAIEARLGALLERCVAENLTRLPGAPADDGAVAARLASLGAADASALLWIAS
ncbi:MAG TPA: hypothetical protein VFP84_26495, partial [Kofleriaceae bacterium]|nr:hypothetical protein [Kofleriaceae bacterium]